MGASALLSTSPLEIVCEETLGLTGAGRRGVGVTAVKRRASTENTHLCLRMATD